MVNTRSEIRAITRKHKRTRDARDAIRAAPIMTLPAEIRAMIYGLLAPVDRIKIDCSDSLATAFNPYGEYHLSLENGDVGYLMIAIYIDLGLLPALCKDARFAEGYAEINRATPRSLLGMKPDPKCIYCKRAPHTIITDRYISFWAPRYIESTDEYIFAMRFTLARLRHDIVGVKCEQIMNDICVRYRLILSIITHFVEKIGGVDQSKRDDVAAKYLCIFEEYYVNNPIIPLGEIIAFHQEGQIGDYSMIVPFIKKESVLNYSILCKLFSYFVPYITKLDNIQLDRYDSCILNMVYNTKNILRLINTDKLRDCHKETLAFKIKAVNPAILRNHVIRQFLCV